MTRPIDLDNQPPIHAEEVDNEVADRRLPAKLRAFAAPVTKGAPNDRLGLDVVRTLLACEAFED